MIYSLRMTSRARFELLALAETLDRRATFEVSRRWMKGVVKSIQSLENLPHRCTLAPESEDLGIPLRLLLHGKRNATAFVGELAGVVN